MHGNKPYLAELKSGEEQVRTVTDIVKNPQSDQITASTSQMDNFQGPKAWIIAIHAALLTVGKMEFHRALMENPIMQKPT